MSERPGNNGQAVLVGLDFGKTDYTESLEEAKQLASSAGVGALTPAERRVADIAASGSTNREIARRLYLSPKTVEMHLRSAYRKLDLPGRGGLAAALEDPLPGGVDG